MKLRDKKVFHCGHLLSHCVKKSTVKTLFSTQIIANTWLLCIAIHMIFFTGHQGAYLFFDKIVFYSSFIVYLTHDFLGSSVVSALLPFVFQYIFWWSVGIVMRSLYGVIQSLSSSLRGT